MWTGQEAPGDTRHSLGGSRDAGKDHLDSRETPREGPPAASEAPGRHQGGRRSTLPVGLTFLPGVYPLARKGF